MNPFKPSPHDLPNRRRRKRRNPPGGKEANWMLGVMVVALGVLAVVSALEIVRT